MCRGYDYERLEDFQQRMLTEFPQALVLQHPNQPDDSIQQSDAQCTVLSLRVLYWLKRWSCATEYCMCVDKVYVSNKYIFNFYIKMHRGFFYVLVSLYI